MRASGLRIGSAFALALVLLLGSITAGPSVHANRSETTQGARYGSVVSDRVAGGPVAFFYGFVARDASGDLAVRVRAVSITGVVCGSAEVQPSGAGTGFYALDVVTGATRAGCPQAGETIIFTLVYGNIDEASATAEAAIMQPGTAMQLHLARFTLSAAVGGFEGTPPAPGAYASMRWMGPSHTPTEQAIATLGFAVNALYHYNGAAGRYDAFIPGAPDWASAYATVGAGDDVIVVRAP